MNSISVLTIYSHNGVWVFDDPEKGLVREALVAGCPEVLEDMHRQYEIRDPANGFNLLFSPTPFPGHQRHATWYLHDPNVGGDWYSVRGSNGELQSAWLCPSLLKYFEKPPASLYLKAESRGGA